MRWQPSTADEQAMEAALARGDRREFFRILGTTHLYLPVRMDQPDGADRQLLTRRLMGRVHLLAYTSPASLTASLGDRVALHMVSNYPELRAHWPAPAWRLAVNPGLPVDAYVEIWAVGEAVAGRLPVLTAADLMAEEGRRPEIVQRARALMAPSEAR